MQPQMEAPEAKTEYTLMSAVSETVAEMGGYAASLLRTASWIYVPVLSFVIIRSMVRSNVPMTYEDGETNLARQNSRYGIA